MRSRDDTCRIVGEAMAVTMFATFLNPACRGSNFSWEEFSEIVGSLSETQVGMALPVKPTRKQARIAREAGIREAQRLLEKSDILNWWPNPLG